MNHTVLPDDRVKMKEREKIDEHLELARELKKPGNMKVTVLAILADALGMAPKRLEEFEIRGKIQAIQITATRILRKVLET